MSEIEQNRGALQGEGQEEPRGGSREATQSAGQGESREESREELREESRGERQTEFRNEQQSERQDESREEPLFYDALFHQKRKRGRWRIVEASSLEAPVADTHCHLHFLKDPALALARAAIHRVEFICEIVDISEDSSEPFDKMDTWLAQAEALIPRLLHASATGDVAENAVENTIGDANENVALPTAVATERAEATSKTTPHVPRIRMVVGCHPHNAKDYNDEVERNLYARLADPRVCAVGEIGLDYHYDFSPREQQRQVFRRQLRIAKQAGLPVALHVREAHDDAFTILEDEGFPEAGCLLHCFNLDWNELERWCDRGCFVAFGGPLTFKKTDEVRDAAARTPLHLLLTETDAPFMTPEPLRGTTCGPEHVVFTAQCMCDVRGCEEAEQRRELFEVLMANARALLDRDATTWQREHGA